MAHTRHDKKKSKNAKAKDGDKHKDKAAKRKASKVDPIPKSYSSLVPTFRVAKCAGAVEFLRSVFGAKLKDSYEGPNGEIVHAELRIGDVTLMCGEANGADVQTLCASIYTKKCDAVFDAAIAQGATAKQPPTDQFYGDRVARVVDPWGNEWLIATHIEDVSKKEMRRRMEALMAGGAAE